MAGASWWASRIDARLDLCYDTRVKWSDIVACIERALKSLIAGQKPPQPRLIPVPVRSRPPMRRR
ncbi:MAG: hypothetical protein EB084_13895 [Proteobacteria bacterium]|nr:hypothetical protein [Pseudomonadota bacterium]